MLNTGSGRSNLEVSHKAKSVSQNSRVYDPESLRPWPPVIQFPCPLGLGTDVRALLALRLRLDIDLEANTRLNLSLIFLSLFLISSFLRSHRFLDHTRTMPASPTMLPISRDGFGIQCP